MRFKFLKIKTAKGQTLIELILIMGIMAIILPALLTGFVASRAAKPQAEQRARAVSVLKEVETAVKNIKNTNWDALSVNGTYHTEIAGSAWTLVAGSFTNPEGITHEIVISDAYRDPVGGAIVESGGNSDPSTKKVEINITWEKPYASSVNSVMYFTRTNNESFTETTQNDFNAGTPTNVSVEATGGSPTDGHIELVTVGSGGGGGGGGSSADWCEPNLNITALNLPKNGVANAVSAIEGQVFAATGENSSGVSFANVDITNTDPPNSSITGTFDGYKTNDIFGEENFAYLATDTNSEEIVIINLSASPYTKSGYFDAPGNVDGNSIYVSGNIGYMTANNRLYTFNLSSKSGSRPILDSDGVLLSGGGTGLFVVGNYAYVSTNGANQLQIIDVSNPSNLQVVGQLSVPGGAGRDIYVTEAGDRAYLVTWASAQNEFFIINTETKSNPLLVTGGVYDTGGMSPKGVTAINEHDRAVVVGSGGEEYQVINISDESSPVRCGGLNINTGVNGVSSVFEGDGDAYSYIITGDASAELKIIEGGPGGNIINTNWCSPETAIIDTLTIPRVGNTISAIASEAFIGSGNGTNGAEFVDVGITSPPPPANPDSSVIGSLSGSHQTNDVFSDGSYAYLAVNSSSAQVLILDIRSSPFTQVGTISISGATGANGVYVDNNVAYVTSGDKLYTFDVTTKSGTHNTPLVSIDLYKEEEESPVAGQVEVVGNKAFVSASGTIYGLQVFLITSSGSSLRNVGVADLPYSQTATGVSVNSTGTRGYVSFTNGSGAVPRGYFTVNTSEVDPPIWWPLPNFYPILATYNSGGTAPTDIALIATANNRALLTGDGGEFQYHVVDISVDADPVMCGGLSIPEGVKGVASVRDSFDRGFSYIITGEASNQFKVIQGGSGGGDFTEDGIFESGIFEVSGSASFNRFIANVDKPDQTTLRMQIAVAPQVSNSCSLATYDYVGPDGSSTSFFNPSGGAIASPIPFGNHSNGYENPAQCFRYKTWFTTWNTAETPSFNDITVNYSP
jgi:type II secretory pathway pseudopilin PulG